MSSMLRARTLASSGSDMTKRRCTHRCGAKFVTKGVVMYIGGGAVVLILIIVVIVLLMRR